MLLLLAAPAAQAQFTYTTNYGAITITGYTGPGGAVMIPSRITGLSVTSIGDFAFAASGLTSVTIPNSVTSIGNDAFLACESLTSVAIPDSVTSIGEGAFTLCSGLASATIGSGVSSIGDDAFAHCANLTGVYLMGNAPSADSTVFASDTNATVYYFSGTTGWGVSFDDLPTARFPFGYTTNNGAITLTVYTGSGSAVAIPSSLNGLPVTVIGSQAFLATGPTSVTIPASITNIGERAFLDCYVMKAISVDSSNPAYASLDGVLFNRGQTALVQYPLGNAEASYTIPDSVTSIGDSAFQDCESLTSIAIPGTVTNLGADAFYECENLTNVTIGDGVIIIGDHAFFNCYKIAGLKIGNGVISIGDTAFAGCESLTSVTLPNSVISLDDHAFDGCGNLSSVTLGSSLSSIGASAFEGTALASVAIGNSVTNIGAWAFFGCDRLTGLTIGNRVISIGDDAFSGCSALTSLIIPGSVASIGQDAFAYCSGMLNVALSSGITNIAEEAFYDCSSLTSFTIPGSVTNIGVDAFYACASLTNLAVDAGNASYSSMSGVLFNKGRTTLIAFPANAPSTVYPIPSGVISIGQDAFSGSTHLTMVTMPISVTSIGGGAFADCYGLTNVTVPNSVTSIGQFAFMGCWRLTEALFMGNAPGGDSTVFAGDVFATAYYFPGTTGWGATFGGIPTALLPVTYTTNNGTITITSFVAPGGAVTIPGTLGGLPVTGIGSDAFAGSTFTSVTIPAGVISIGLQAFGNCANLTAINVEPGNPAYSSLDGVLFDQSQNTLIQYPPGKVGASYTVPQGVTRIGDSAFSGCLLANVTIPSGVAHIGDWAFYDCSALAGVALGNGVTDIGYGTFAYCGSLTSITLPASVTSIGDEAFFFDTDLSTVSLGSGVSNIGDDAFASCANLVGVYFMGNAPSPDATVFDSDSNATAYYFPGTTGWGASFDGLLTALFPFAYTTNSGALTITGYTGSGGAVAIPCSIHDLPVTSVGGYAFNDKTSLTTVTLPTSVTNLGISAFANCYNLTTVAIPAGITTIADLAFNSCFSLTNVSLPNSVTNIGEAAFQQSGLTSLTIPNSVISIGLLAFANCNGLTNVAIPSSVATIAQRAFVDCGYLVAINVDAANGAYSSVNGVLFDKGQTLLLQYPEGKVEASYIIPDTVTSIGVAAFAGCGLSSVTIANSVTNIGDVAFTDCYYLTNVTILNSVTTIGGEAFAASGLTGVTIPSSVINLGDLAFWGCQHLTAINVDPANPAYSSAAGVLFNRSQTTLIEYPEGKTATSYTVPGSVTAIAAYAFNQCLNLAGIYFTGNAPFTDSTAFSYDFGAAAYYLPGTAGWGPTFGGIPTALWMLPYPLILATGSGFGVRSNQFGFTVAWATNLSVVVEASTNLVRPVWQPLQTNTLTGGSFYFSDPQFANHPIRFYRLRSP